MNDNQSLIDWLLSGDISIRYHVKRDLLNFPEKKLTSLQTQIPLNGWGRRILSKRNPKNGLWGGGVYLPKWTSTHYTLLDLKNLGISQSNNEYVESSGVLLDRLWFNKGEVAKKRIQDICVSAMLLSICGHAKIRSPKFDEIIDYLIDKRRSDGGWNCSWWKGSEKSSLHSTLTILESLRDLEANGYSYRLNELKILRDDAHELLLKRKLFRSLTTEEVIDKKMLMLSYPSRWRYDILRSLDYFQSIDAPYDDRMQDAIEILLKKRKPNGRWPVQHKHAGLVHFDMEQTGEDSRWNTLRALRVLMKYRKEYFEQAVANVEPL